MENIIAGNDNFEKKNIYSKEKYLKKKQQKFMKWFCPRLPTTRLLSEHFNRKDRDPGRLLDLRLDGLSQVLGHVNVFPGCKIMVWDDSMGFASGAVLSRMDPDIAPASILVSVHTTPTLQTPFLPYYNLSDAQKSQLYALNLSEIGPAPLEPTPNHYNPSSEGNPEHLARHQARWEQRQAHRRRSRACFDSSLFTSILLVCNESDPAALIDRFSPFLAASGRLVVYSKFKETLLPAFIQTRFASNPSFVDVSLTESWLRPYQTASGRLHPEMSMPCSAAAGFILTATRVLDE